jgi:DNA-binding LacI/PurR family transcriptional regulator
VPELAKRAVAAAIDRIAEDRDHAALALDVLLEPRLVVRGTTAPPPAP